MPKKSTNANKKPQFATEAEEADWLASPAGRRHAAATLRRALREGVVTVEKNVTLSEATRITKESDGKLVRFAKGLKIRPTDPAVLEKLLQDARASMTKAVSLRIPVSDLDAAKEIAAKKGVGYQTVLKDAIKAGLRRA